MNVSIIGYNRVQSRKNGKFYMRIAYSYTSPWATSGSDAESVIVSDEYGNKLLQYYGSGGEVHRGWDKNGKKPFLYMK